MSFRWKFRKDPSLWAVMTPQCLIKSMKSSALRFLMSPREKDLRAFWSYVLAKCTKERTWPNLQLDSEASERAEKKICLRESESLRLCMFARAEPLERRRRWENYWNVTRASWADISQGEGESDNESVSGLTACFLLMRNKIIAKLLRADNLR